MDLAQEPEGSVMFGWVAPAVYFARFTGKLSMSLGAAHLSSLERAAASVPTLRYFCDCSRLTTYDLLARSGFVRVLLSNRKKFRDIVILNWAGGISQAGNTLVETIGEPLLLLDDRGSFERRLTAAAPHHDLVLRMRAASSMRVRSAPQPAERVRR